MNARMRMAAFKCLELRFFDLGKSNFSRAREKFDKQINNKTYTAYQMLKVVKRNFIL